VLFRSRARGDYESDSDIDVLVVLKGSEGDLPEPYEDVPIEMEFDLKYGIMVSILTIDEERFRKRQSPMLINVRREGLAIA
jgi:predicted nucleotidyltransferase